MVFGKKEVKYRFQNEWIQITDNESGFNVRLFGRLDRSLRNTLYRNKEESTTDRF